MHIAWNKNIHLRLGEIASKVSRNKFFSNACIIVNAFFGFKYIYLKLI